MHRYRLLINSFCLMVVAPTLGVSVTKWHHHAPAVHPPSCGHHHDDHDQEPLPGDDSCVLCAVAQTPVADLTISVEPARFVPNLTKHSLTIELIVVSAALTHGARAPPERTV